MIKTVYQRAFSLIEVLVAVAIMSLIGLASIKAFDMASASNQHIEETSQRLNQLQRAFLFISNDIQQLAERKVRDEYGDVIPTIKSDLQSSKPYMELTRLGRRNPAQLPRSNLEHLKYSLEDKILYRISYTYADGMQEEAGLKRPILNQVEKMEIQFYDGEEWHDYWPLSDDPNSELAQQKPVAIKFGVETSHYGLLERWYVLRDKN